MRKVQDLTWSYFDTEIKPHITSSNTLVQCPPKLGTFQSNGHIRLIIVISGTPSPSVVWLRNGIKMDSTFKRYLKFHKEIGNDFSSRTDNRTIKNILSVSHLTRADLHSEFTCIVSNNNISSPISNTVHLDMNCKDVFFHSILTISISVPPTSVAIERHFNDLVVGTKTNIICR